MSNELYRDFIDRKADSIINSLGGTITPAPANAELYRDFLDRKFNDVINALPFPIKSFTYTGTGSGTKVLDIPANCHLILSIYGRNLSHGTYNASRTGMIILVDNITRIVDGKLGNDSNDSQGNSICRYTYDSTNRKLTLIAGSTIYNSNWSNGDYTVYYI